MEFPEARIREKAVYDNLMFRGKNMIIYNLKYPFIQLENQKAQNRINNQIKDDLMHCLSHIKNSLLPICMRGCGDENFKTYMVNRGFNISFNESGLLSLCGETCEYTDKKYSRVTRWSRTFSLRGGRLLEWENLFARGYDYKFTLKQHIFDKIKSDAQNGEKYFDNAISAANDKFSERCMYIKKGSLAVFYQPGTLMPYSAGVPEFEIPVSVFGDSIKIDI